MDTVIVPRDARLSRHENALVVISDAGRKAIPLNGVKHVVCMGDGSILHPPAEGYGAAWYPFHGA